MSDLAKYINIYTKIGRHLNVWKLWKVMNYFVGGGRQKEKQDSL